MDGYKNALALLPPELASVFPIDFPDAEEIRLRCGQAPTVYANGQEHKIESPILAELELRRVLERATGASLHTAAAALRRGYICSRGLRIGVCGSAVIRGGEMEGFRSFSSLCIRIPHDFHGICSAALKAMNANTLGGCIITGAPGSGKTTALRDMIRLLSERGFRVGVADERGEISGDGEFPLGSCTDIITGLYKHEAAMLLLRGMRPDFIAMDEITQSADAAAIREICCCGVELIVSAHARSTDELLRRPVFAKLMESGAFRYVLTVSHAGRERSYELNELHI